MPKPLTFELVGDTQIVVTREFDAPPALVWRAHTEPELVAKWQAGFDGWDLKVTEFDFSVGGRYRLDYSGPDDATMSITGTFLEVDAPYRIVQEEIMLMPDPTPANHVETRFSEQGAGTRMVMTMTLPDAETRKAMMDTGMLDGMEFSYQALDALELA
ncbi:SRPBCC domain-containing protein [Maritimibacter dapengensis]|uniref:SRPBCC domain-containing protein n=1 Tax=Maritimibacter dapengensis TaxID=2836868 RepID=A0ABS6SWZ5_9RHOB|nr:SRPBCC domain-containing protein [Maritimibacter dapengensis]MBV7377481.1 SRPBCC domain-containing protein [Maritimibacter dapengensis]